MPTMQPCSSTLRMLRLWSMPTSWRDLALAYVVLAEADDKEACCKMALKIYKKALKIYSGSASELEERGDPRAMKMQDLAENCHRSMASCRRVLKIAKKKSKNASQPSGVI